MQKMESKKEKEQSDYMMEMKEKTAYKKYENIFETIQQIKKEKRRNKGSVD